MDVDHSIGRVQARVHELADADPAVLKDLILSNQGCWPSSGTLMEYINVYVEGLQHVLDEENAKLQPTRQVDDWRGIRQQQDAEFEEAVKADQAFEAAKADQAFEAAKAKADQAFEAAKAGFEAAVPPTAAELRELRAAAAEARIRQNQLPH